MKDFFNPMTFYYFTVVHQNAENHGVGIKNLMGKKEMNKVSNAGSSRCALLAIITMFTFCFSSGATASPMAEQGLFQRFHDRNISKKSAFRMIRLKLVLREISIRATENGSNNTFLHYASKFGPVENVEFFTGKGIPIDAVNVYGYTPLMEAAVHGHSEIVRILLKNGATIDLKDNNGKTALEMAERNNHREVIQILKNAGTK